MISALLALLTPGEPNVDPVLYRLGYELHAINLPMADRLSRRFELDVMATCVERNVSVMIDCKTYPDKVDPDQINKYLKTSPTEVIVHGGITTDDPGGYQADAAFFVLPDVEAAIVAAVRQCKQVFASGWGLVTVDANLIRCIHDDLSDRLLSASLGSGWEVEFARLPLERLPYEADSPPWELADALFRTILTMFVTGVREFSLEDVCRESNEWWPYFEALHDHIRGRVRKEIVKMRKTALRGWIETTRQRGEREDTWRFKRARTTNARVLSAFSKRHNRYVSIRQKHGDPRIEDFEGLDYDQAPLPFPVADAQEGT